MIAKNPLIISNVINLYCAEFCEMKKLFVCILLLSSGFLSAQDITRKDTLDLICRKWKIESIEESMLNNMDAAEKENIKKGSAVFLKDGSFSSFVGDTIAASGKWKYVSNQKKLVATYDDETNFTVIIITSISTTKMEGQSYTSDDPKKFKVVMVAATSQ